MNFNGTTGYKRYTHIGHENTARNEFGLPDWYQCTDCSYIFESVVHDYICIQCEGEATYAPAKYRERLGRGRG